MNEKKKEDETKNAHKHRRQQTNMLASYCVLRPANVYIYLFSVSRIHEELFLNLMCVSRRRVDFSASYSKLRCECYRFREKSIRTRLFWFWFFFLLTSTIALSYSAYFEVANRNVRRRIHHTTYVEAERIQIIRKNKSQSRALREWEIFFCNSMVYYICLTHTFYTRQLCVVDVQIFIQRIFFLYEWR